MTRPVAERIRSALGDPQLRAFDPEAVDRLGRILADAGDLAALSRATPHGGVICFLPPLRGPVPRRIFTLDRHGTLVTALRWETSGSLARASVRTAHEDWIGIEAEAGWHGTWGGSDRLWRLPGGPSWQSREPLTVFKRLDWDAIGHIPPLAEPARLPPGGGTAVLNLIAALATDQGVNRLRYEGPYPTESLFTALLESFRFIESAADPLRRFYEGRLDWTPAPHELRFTPERLCIQMRESVEKVVFRGRAYYRGEWQSVRRHAPRRVRDAAGGVRCSLWVLGAPLEDHLVLDAHGTVVAMPDPATDRRPPAPVSAPVAAGIEALVCAMSAPALRGQIRQILAAFGIEWGPVSGDLLEMTATGARLSWRLAAAGAARVRSARSRAERVGRALEVLTEMARLLGDSVRAHAQSALAAEPDALKPAALEDEVRADRGAAAIAAGAAALADQLAELLPDPSVPDEQDGEDRQAAEDGPDAGPPPFELGLGRGETGGGPDDFSPR